MPLQSHLNLQGNLNEKRKSQEPNKRSHKERFGRGLNDPSEQQRIYTCGVWTAYSSVIGISALLRCCIDLNKIDKEDYEPNLYKYLCFISF